MPRKKVKLFQDLCSTRRLTSSWEEVFSNNSYSPETKQFAVASRHNLQVLRKSLIAGKFHFGKYRASVLKEKKKLQPIMSPHVQDKIVQRAILNTIYPTIKTVIENDVSYGSIKKRTIEKAVGRIVALYKEGYEWVFESDIINFFNNIDRKLLLEKILSSLRDDSINALLTQAVNAEIENYDIIKEFEHLFPGAGIGIPQGSILSPMFANLYLAPFDSHMTEKGFKLIRYVDDFIVLCKTQEEAVSAYEIAYNFLTDLKLSIHKLNVPNANGKIKTKITVYKDGFDFLGINFTPRRLQPSGDKISSFKQKVKDITTYPGELREPIIEKIISLNRLIKGWGNAYRFCNMCPIYTTMDQMICKRVSYFLFNHGFAKKRLTIKAMKLLGVEQLGHIRVSPICL